MGIRESAELTWLFEDSQGEIKRGVYSPMSRWEHELRARAETARHHGYYERDDLGVHACPGTDLRCGDTVHPSQHVTAGGAPSREYIDTRSMGSASRFSRAVGALDAAGAEIKAMASFRYEQIMPPEFWAFDPASKDLWKARAKHEKMLAAGPTTNAPDVLNAHGGTNVRGPGNLAHLTVAILEAHAASRSSLDPRLWAAEMGLRLSPDALPGVRATAQERAICHLARAQVLVLDERMQKAFRKESSHVPSIVQRRARWRRGPR